MGIPYLVERWSQDDFDVVEDGVIVGRIFTVPIAPGDHPWMWASGHNGDIRRAAHSYEPTHEAAMAAFCISVKRAVQRPPLNRGSSGAVCK
jgi:hypothetical protein